MINPTEYKWKNCFYEKQQKCITLAKTNSTYCSMLSARVFKQLWWTCLFNIMNEVGLWPWKENELQYFALCLNCKCCNRKGSGTGNAKGYFYIRYANTHISKYKQTSFLLLFSHTCLSLSPIPVTCNSDSKHAGLQPSAEMYYSCIWGITAPEPVFWKHLAQAYTIPPSSIICHRFLCRENCATKNSHCLVNSCRKLHKYFPPAQVIHPSTTHGNSSQD